MRSASSSIAMAALGLMLMALVGQSYANHLSVGYYNGKCGKHNVEEIIFNVIKFEYMKDHKTVAHIVRMQFHDCIVRGCDASVLLDGAYTEKTAPPNLSLGSFDALDAAKSAVEKVCPGVVSCADVLVLAARSAVFLGGGKWYYAETGRRDGRVSSRSEALANLPPQSIAVSKAVHLFAQRGLSKEDFVILLGAHTIGTVHCDKFQDRLYNFHHSGKSDPSMNPALLHELKKTCPRNGRVNNLTYLDHTPRSHYRFDNAYYKQLLASKGILEVDNNLAYSPLTQGIVKKLAFTPGYFLDKFGPAMINLGRVGVLTGNQGEIRKSCRAVNH